MCSSDLGVSKFVFDIHWTSLQGDRIASMAGVEMYALQESKARVNGSVL